MKSFSTLCLAVILSLVAVNAQENFIEYGEQVTVEFADPSSEFIFSFEGSAEDIIVIEMYPTSDQGDFDTPELVIRDEADDILVRASDPLNIGRTLLAIQLPKNGRYSIEVALRQVMQSDGIGEFVLEIIDVATLQVATSVVGSVTREESNDYYVIFTESRNLNLNYTKEGGNFSPEISINTIDQNGTLRSAIELSGDELLQGQVNVPTSQAFYIVKVGSIFNVALLIEGTADYRLELTAAE